VVLVVGTVGTVGWAKEGAWWYAVNRPTKQTTSNALDRRIRKRACTGCCRVPKIRRRDATRRS
jgi:hypothetical protein